MITPLEQDHVSINANGAIDLPIHLRQSAGLNPSDEFLLVWLPPDTLVLRKRSEIAADEQAFSAAMHEFDQTLRLAGYETDDEILNLIRDIKREQVDEWTTG